MTRTLRIGTRGSPLALIQAEEVRSRLKKAHPSFRSEQDIELVPIRTEGDWRSGQKEVRFFEIGGNKGLFTRQIEEALVSGAIDMAVHSMKDVDGRMPESLEIAALLPRADARDAFIGRDVTYLRELPEGSSVGTSSLRRQVQILARRPDLRVVPLRGNVDTRLKKLSDGIADATLLAVAGLSRLGLEDRICSILPTSEMLPSAAQGAIGIEIRKGDDAMRDLLEPINCQDTSICVRAERAMVEILDGSCQTPIGALAQLDGDQLTLEGLAALPDGSGMVRLSERGNRGDFEALGKKLGTLLKSHFPSGFHRSL